MDSSSYRQSLLADFQEQRKYAETLLVRSSKEQLLWQPNDETWCMAQVVEHMRIVNDNYLKRAAEVIRGRRPSEPESQEYGPSGLGQRVINAMGPKGNFTMAVPKKFVPHLQSLPRDVTTLFLDQFAAVDVIIKESVGADLKKSKVSSPVSRLLKFQLGDVFKIILVHNDRHLRQIDRLQRISGYPQNVVATAERGPIT